MTDPDPRGGNAASRRSKLHPYAGAAVARSGLEGWRPVLYAVAACLTVAGLLFYLLGRGETPPALPQPEPVPAAAAGSLPVAEPPPPVAAPAESPPSAVAHDPPAQEATQDLTEVLAAVEAWARAWSRQRAEEYLAFYAADFSPPRGMSRADWNAQRRERISRPRRIEVRITDLDAEGLGPASARVNFLQLYVSDNYRDTTRKTLQLIVEEGRWKIADEQSGS